MDKTTFRILNTSSTMLSSATSISGLTSSISKSYGAAYYKNIYDKIHKLEKQNIINLTKIGNISIPTINFNNYLTIDLLAEMELKKKQNFLEKNMEMQMLFLEMETYFKEFYSIKSISIISPEKNTKLNRAEFLFLLKEPQSTINEKPKGDAIRDEILEIRLIFQQLQKIHNIKLDYLILKEKEFIELLKSEEINPLKEMLSDKIVLFGPQAFWGDIKTALSQGIQIRITDETNPAKIAEKDLIYNLGRFGYKEIGSEIKQGKEICIEIIITSLLLQNDARRIEAIPVLLAKNKTDYNLLIFLCKKYNRLEKFFGLINALNRIKPGREIEDAIRILGAMEIKEEKIDETSIKQKMRLYDAT